MLCVVYLKMKLNIASYSLTMKNLKLSREDRKSIERSPHSEFYCLTG